MLAREACSPGGERLPAWGHPIRWLVPVVGVAFGHAVGLVTTTPRYTVKRGSR